MVDKGAEDELFKLEETKISEYSSGISLLIRLDGLSKGIHLARWKGDWQGLWSHIIGYREEIIEFLSEDEKIMLNRKINEVNSHNCQYNRMLEDNYDNNTTFGRFFWGMDELVIIMNGLANKYGLRMRPQKLGTDAVYK